MISPTKIIGSVIGNSKLFYYIGLFVVAVIIAWAVYYYVIRNFQKPKPNPQTTLEFCEQCSINKPEFQCANPNCNAKLCISCKGEHDCNIFKRYNILK